MPSHAAAERRAFPPAGVAFWHRRRQSATLQSLPVRGDLSRHAQPGRRNHARSMHAGIRAGAGENGGVAALSPRPVGVVGVPSARTDASRGNHPAANALRWRQIGEGGRGSPGMRAGRAGAIHHAVDRWRPHTCNTPIRRAHLRGSSCAGQPRRGQADGFQQRSGRGTRADPAVAWRVARTGCDFGDNSHHPE